MRMILKMRTLGKNVYGCTIPKNIREGMNINSGDLIELEIVNIHKMNKLKIESDIPEKEINNKVSKRFGFR